MGYSKPYRIPYRENFRMTGGLRSPPQTWLTSSMNPYRDSPNWRPRRVSLLWCNDVFTRRTFRPDAFCSIVSLVFNQHPCRRDALIAVWAATETLRVVGHGKGMEGACDSVPSVQNSTGVENKCLADFRMNVYTGTLRHTASLGCWRCCHQ
jgi:hypothetical protein